MLSTSNLPHGFWREALKIAVHVCNRSPHISLKGCIPEEVCSSKPASYEHLRIFDCDAFVCIRPVLRSKLDTKYMKGIFMGYGDEDEMGYKIWLPQLKKVTRSRNVVFNEASLLKTYCAKCDHRRLEVQHVQPLK